MTHQAIHAEQSALDASHTTDGEAGMRIYTACNVRLSPMRLALAVPTSSTTAVDDRYANSTAALALPNTSRTRLRLALTTCPPAPAQGDSRFTQHRAALLPALPAPLLTLAGGTVLADLCACHPEPSTEQHHRRSSPKLRHKPHARLVLPLSTSCWAAHKPALICPALPRRRVLYLFAASDSLFETKSPVPRSRLVLISDWHTQLRTQATCHETRALHITSIICTLTWTATGNCLL